MKRSSERCRKMRRPYAHSFLLCLFIILLHTLCSLAAPTSAPNSTTASASPPTTTAAASPPTKTSAPPPTTSSAPPPTGSSGPPPTVSASPPLSALPPKPAAATPPTASTTPPPVAAPTHSTTKPPAASVPPPKASTNSTAPQPSRTPPPKAAAPAPAKVISPPAHAPAPAPVAVPDLDPSQLAALHALKVNVSSPDPCKTSSEILLCDSTPPPRHLVSLSLKNCPTTASLSIEALLNLSSLQSLEFDNCFLKPVHVPKVLVKSLKQFICSASLGRTSQNEKANKLSGVWLSTLSNVEELVVTDVEVTARGLSTIVQNMDNLAHLTVSRVNLPGVLPKKTWSSGLQYIDLSGNSIRGTLPSQMRTLSQLTYLDLSDNQIKGVLPNIFGDLSQLQYIDLRGNQFSGPIPGSLASLRNCSRLDLSNNLLNGTIPANLTLIRTLRYLDLSQNALTGPIPFNSTFLNRLKTLKLSNNAGLCYNHTALKSKFLSGIRNCVSVVDDTAAFAPAPGPAASNLSAGSGKSGRISKGAAAGISIVVIVAAAAVVFGVRKWWKSRDDGEAFENLRAQKERP